MGIIMVEKDTKNKEKVEGFINRKEMRKFLMENDVHSLDDVEDIIELRREYAKSTTKQNNK